MKKFFCLLLITIYSSVCSAQITQVSDMKDVFAYFEEADAHTLAVFDVDMVLVQPSDPAFQMPTMKRYKSIAKQIMKDVSDEMVFLSLMGLAGEPILVDSNTPRLLSNLHKKGVCTIAFTANLTGSLGAIPNMAEWRICHLKRLGLNFSEHSPYKQRIIFSQFPSYRHYYPEYIDGILFTNGNASSKGEVFVEFLKEAHVRPTKIIFVDDREENLKSVEEALQKFDSSIAYEGIIYVGAKNYPSIEITEKQFELRWQALANEANSLSS